MSSTVPPFSLGQSAVYATPVFLLPNIETYTPRQLLAYALSNMKGIGGYNGWRWIFIIEGLVTVILALIAKLLIVDWPETAKFLNESEREMLTRRLQEDNLEVAMNTLTKSTVRRIFSDWKIYIGYYHSLPRRNEAC